MSEEERSVRRRRVAAAAVVVGVAVLLGVAAQVDGDGEDAAPRSLRQSPAYVPIDGEQVVESLPPLDDELRGLRARLGSGPDTLDAAVALARRHIEIARARSDERHLGYAQAALAPWWDRPSPPLEVLLLRATIRQSQHDFAGAMADLDDLLARSPQHTQGLLTRAVIAQVRGEYDEARESCLALTGAVAPLVLAACSSAVDGLTGHAAQAVRVLESALGSAPQASAAERVWARVLLGELEARRGRLVAAERHLRAALVLAPDDAQVLVTYADFLLDRARPREVLGLLAGREHADGLLLRLAIASAAVGAPGAARHTADLRARFAAAHARGDRIHLREEARFQLELERDPDEALRLARENWDIQREPPDARIFLAAAIAAGDPAAAAPVLEWLRSSGIEDPALARLAHQLQVDDR